MTPYTQPRSNQKQIYIHNLDMIIGPWEPNMTIQAHSP